VTNTHRDHAGTPLTNSAHLYDAFDSDPSPVIAFLRDVVAPRTHAERPRVLDVGCGTGRLFGPLRALGWELVGLEPDPEYRDRAAAVGATVGVPVHPGTFNSVAAFAEFDLVVGINGAFAYVRTPRDRLDALEQCRQALRGRGALVLDMPNTLKILFEYQEPAPVESVVDGHRIRLTREHVVDYGAATFTTHETYTIVPSSGAATTVDKVHPYAITTWPDLAHLLGRAGFAQAEVYDNFSARIPGRGNGRRHVIVAQVT
jgi:SAM-dependent methyltransferase